MSVFATVDFVSWFCTVWRYAKHSVCYRNSVIHLSVTPVHCIKTDKCIFKLFSLYCSPTFLVSHMTRLCKILMGSLLSGMLTTRRYEKFKQLPYCGTVIGSHMWSLSIIAITTEHEWPSRLFQLFCSLSEFRNSESVA